MTQSNQRFLHLIEIVKSWQSLNMIPVVRYLLEKKLDNLAIDHPDSPTLEQLSPEEIKAYWQKYQDWKQADLNPIQKKWLREIHLHLDSLQQSLFKSRPKTHESAELSSDNKASPNF